MCYCCTTQLHLPTAIRAAEGRYESVHGRLDRYDRADYESCRDAVRRRLGEEVFTEMWNLGPALSPLEALEAHDAEVPEDSERTGHNALYDLSARQIEVLQLVAQGLSDAEVAERLSLSKHTINAHLRAIYSEQAYDKRAPAGHLQQDRC